MPNYSNPNLYLPQPSKQDALARARHDGLLSTELKGAEPSHHNPESDFRIMELIEGWLEISTRVAPLLAKLCRGMEDKITLEDLVLKRPSQLATETGLDVKAITAAKTKILRLIREIIDTEPEFAELSWSGRVHPVSNDMVLLPTDQAISHINTMRLLMSAYSQKNITSINPEHDKALGAFIKTLDEAPQLKAGRKNHPQVILDKKAVLATYSSLNEIDAEHLATALANAQKHMPPRWHSNLTATHHCFNNCAESLLSTSRRMIG